MRQGGKWGLRYEGAVLLLNGRKAGQGRITVQRPRKRFTGDWCEVNVHGH